MMTEQLRKILVNTSELCDYMENKIDYSDLDSDLMELFKQELVAFLCRLALADDVIVLEEIEFINDMFGDEMNLLDVKSIGRDYNTTGDYIIPKIIEKAVEYDLDSQNTSFAQNIVNTFYFAGVEFIACDLDVAASEIYTLTELISNYQNYLRDEEVAGEAFDIIEDLRTRKFIKTDKEKYIATDNNNHSKKIENASEMYTQSNEISELMTELNKSKYDKVRMGMLTLINHIRIRNFRKCHGLKNNEMSSNMVLFGGKSSDVDSISQIIAKLFCYEGMTGEKFVTNFTCMSHDNLERLQKTINTVQKGNILIQNANQLTSKELDLLMKSTEENELQSFYLSGNTNELILMLEQNRNVYSRFHRCFFLEGISEEIAIDIFEYLCVKNDYLFSKEAKGILKKHLTLIIISIAGIIWGFEYLIEAPMIAWLIWLLTIIISIWCINNLSNGESSKSAFDELGKKQEKAEQKKYNKLHGGVRCPKCNENAGQEISPTSQGVAAGIAKCMGESPYVYFAHRKKYCCKNCGHSW